MDKYQMINFVVNFIVVLSNILTYAIIARILISWFTMGQRPANRFGQLIYDATDPLIVLARKLPHKIGMFDFAPLIALLAIDLLSGVIIFLLLRI